ncbi:DUF362 domain-containing protein [Sulfurospirillum diekertiae]|nr:DUF362 domain-containing protein [Sulfurospirillum diekertiae]
MKMDTFRLADKLPSELNRRGFLKNSAVVLGAITVCNLGGLEEAPAAPNEKAQVYFTDDISVNGLLKIYAKVNQNITGKTAIKLHSGEPHGPNLLPIELITGLQATIPNSTIVECNVLYESPRQHTQSHLETLKINGFDFCPVDIMDAEGDAILPIFGTKELLAKWEDSPKRPFEDGTHLSEIAVGKNLLNYDSLLVYTHFKGHTMGGFGGSLKNIAIGCASGQVGKLQIHEKGWKGGKLFLERMVEAGKGISDHFGPRITYINVLKNISVDCDCDAHGKKPTCRDIGIVASTDILAIDKASIDLVYALPQTELKDIKERIETRNGLHQLEYMKLLRMGKEHYDLINLG